MKIGLKIKVWRWILGEKPDIFEIIQQFLNKGKETDISKSLTDTLQGSMEQHGIKIWIKGPSEGQKSHLETT